MASFNTLAIKPRFGPLTRALIVDSQITTSNILASHLRMLGLGQVVQCARARPRTLRHIQDAGFDFVLCEQRLADGTMGQDLIEELRRSALLSLRTVVMVISADASYNTPWPRSPSRQSTASSSAPTARAGWKTGWPPPTGARNP